MKWPRMKTRSLMAVVLAFGLSLGLGFPAAEVYNGRRLHGHIFVVLLNEGPRLDFEDSLRTPFLQSYWLRLNGKPWKRQPICGPGRGRLEETCEIEDINAFYLNCFNPQERPRPTKSMLDKYPGLSQ